MSPKIDSGIHTKCNKLLKVRGWMALTFFKRNKNSCYWQGIPYNVGLININTSRKWKYFVLQKQSRYCIKNLDYFPSTVLYVSNIQGANYLQVAYSYLFVIEDIIKKVFRAYSFSKLIVMLGTFRSRRDNCILFKKINIPMYLDKIFF